MEHSLSSQSLEFQSLESDSHPRDFVLPPSTLACDKPSANKLLKGFHMFDPLYLMAIYIM